MTIRRFDEKVNLRVSQQPNPSFPPPSGLDRLAAEVGAVADKKKTQFIKAKTDAAISEGMAEGQRAFEAGGDEKSINDIAERNSEKFFGGSFNKVFNEAAAQSYTNGLLSDGYRHLSDMSLKDEYRLNPKKYAEDSNAFIEGGAAELTPELREVYLGKMRSYAGGQTTHINKAFLSDQRARHTETNLASFNSLVGAASGDARNGNLRDAMVTLSESQAVLDNMVANRQMTKTEADKRRSLATVQIIGDSEVKEMHSLIDQGRWDEAAGSFDRLFSETFDDISTKQSDQLRQRLMGEYNQRVSLESKRSKAEQDLIDLNNSIARHDDTLLGNKGFDSTSKLEQEDLDNSFEVQHNGFKHLAGEDYVAAVSEFVVNSGGNLPKKLASQIVAATRSRDPEVFAKNAVLYAALDRTDAGRFLNHQIKDVTARAELGTMAELINTGSSTDLAIEAVESMRNVSAERKAQINEASKEYMINDAHISDFGDMLATDDQFAAGVSGIFGIPIPVGRSLDVDIPIEAQAAYTNLFKAYMVGTNGNVDVAKSEAYKAFKGSWGVSNINGDPELMLLAPEALHIVPGAPEGWARSQMHDQVISSDPDIDLDTVKIVSSLQTATDGSYTVMAVDPARLSGFGPLIGKNGQPMRFTPNKKQAATEAQEISDLELATTVAIERGEQAVPTNIPGRRGEVIKRARETARAKKALEFKKRQEALPFQAEYAKIRNNTVINSRELSVIANGTKLDALVDAKPSLKGRELRSANQKIKSLQRQVDQDLALMKKAMTANQVSQEFIDEMMESYQ